MLLKTVKHTDDSDDILGLVAFGSLITNIVQIASRKSLEKEHAALKAYAGELKKHYENMRIRENHVYKENLELKNAYNVLQIQNNRLLSELIEARKEVFDLKLPTTLIPVKKKVIRRAEGGPR